MGKNVTVELCLNLSVRWRSTVDVQRRNEMLFFYEISIIYLNVDKMFVMWISQYSIGRYNLVSTLIYSPLAVWRISGYDKRVRNGMLSRYFRDMQQGSKQAEQVVDSSQEMLLEMM